MSGSKRHYMDDRGRPYITYTTNVWGDEHDIEGHATYSEALARYTRLLAEGREARMRNWLEYCGCDECARYQGLTSEEWEQL